MRSHAKFYNTKYILTLTAILTVGLFTYLTTNTTASANGVGDGAPSSAGSCQGYAHAPSGHCLSYNGASVVDNCRCSGSATTCAASGSYYCENAQGAKIKGSSGSACEGNCTWKKITEVEGDPVLVD